jgi:hypothetical protein
MFDTIVPTLNLRIRSPISGEMINPRITIVGLEDEIENIDIRILRRLSIEEKMKLTGRGIVPEFIDNCGNLVYESIPSHYKNPDEASINFTRYRLMYRSDSKGGVNDTVDLVSLFPYLSEIISSTWIMTPLTSFDKLDSEIVDGKLMHDLIMKRKKVYTSIVKKYEELTKQSVRVRLSNFRNNTDDGIWIVYGAPVAKYAQ